MSLSESLSELSERLERAGLRERARQGNTGTVTNTYASWTDTPSSTTTTSYWASPDSLRGNWTNSYFTTDSTGRPVEVRIPSGDGLLNQITEKFSYAPEEEELAETQSFINLIQLV